MHFQASLPRLPVPQLEKTCERYLSAQKPILIEEQLRHTESCVQRFLAGEGPLLQKELKAFDAMNKNSSYITEYWFDMYLRDRKPLPINYNPTMVFIPEEDTRYETQLIKSTNLLVSSIRFMKSLRKRILAPEVFHMDPKKSDTETFRKVTGFLPPSLSWYGAYLFKVNCSPRSSNTRNNDNTDRCVYCRRLFRWTCLNTTIFSTRQEFRSLRRT